MLPGSTSPLQHQWRAEVRHYPTYLSIALAGGDRGSGRQERITMSPLSTPARPGAALRVAMGKAWSGPNVILTAQRQFIVDATHHCPPPPNPRLSSFSRRRWHAAHRSAACLVCDVHEAGVQCREAGHRSAVVQSQSKEVARLRLTCT
nr:hypothetical protein CFP56_24599 [Quercus suber]